MSPRSAMRGLRSGLRRRLRPLPFDDTGVHTFDSACYAPNASMYFDQHGNVRACCQNTGVLMGNVVEQSISEIWHSAATRTLRDALKVGDYSQGCGFCQWQVDQGDDAIVFARTFDEHPVYEEHPRWPVQMEFSLTNSCNLQCVMCNGDWSSSIRAHREQRAPLPEVYGEQFFDELEEFLPHLRKANFLGGEPFLGREPLRVLGMLADLPSPPSVVVTTNGTQWSRRIEDLCERLPMSIVVSLDGITKETYESIRIGADFDEVMANLERFGEYTARHGTRLSLAHCLMRANWHEFAQLLRFAEDRGVKVGMNEVLFPVELSLFQAPAEELREVVSAMEADADGVAASLVDLRHVWDGQLEALRHRLEDLDGGRAVLIRPWADASDQKEPWSRLAARTLAEWANGEAPTVVTLEPNRAGTVAGEHSTFLSTLGVTDAVDAEDLLARLGAYLGPAVARTHPSSELLHDVELADPSGTRRTRFRAAWASVEGRTTIHLAVRDPEAPPELPDDPLGVLRAWAAPGEVVVLECDADERICSVTGPLDPLGLSSADELIGRPTDDLLELLGARFGPTRVEPGPSGLAADSLVSLGDGQGAPRMRVMVQRSDDALLVMVAPERAT